MNVKTKYRFYELSVQTPSISLYWYDTIYRDLRGRSARIMREDFCGTFILSANWVKRHEENRAIALDLDPEPLAFGKSEHLQPLSSTQKKRIAILRQNVMSRTTPLADIEVAGNFSFNIFKKWEELVRYFRFARESLDRGGLLILEQGGGPGFIEESKDRRPIQKHGKKLFTYIWDQQYFNPINHHARYGIHFKMPNGKIHENVFSYDWRLWSIPEIRVALKEAGFKDTCVYWEGSTPEGSGDGIFERMEEGDNSYAWTAYIVGMTG